MSKQEMLVEYITQDIVLYMMSESSYEIDKAMNAFYNSAVFEKLSDIETGLYLESSAYIYELLKDELASGRIIQREV
jgi:predicted transcriptional regulator